MPRNRTVRLAVLGSSVQRAANSGYPSNRSSALKRRSIVGGLVLASLVLITVSFRSSALDGAQGTAASVLRPFEVAADRTARPFRDAVGWTRGLFTAKSENERLKRQVDALRRQAAANESALQQNVQLQALLDYRSSPTLRSFRTVAAEVLVNPPSRFEQRIVIAAGSSDGIRAQDVVVNDQGLVGTVTRVFSREARVTLLTDEQGAATARDLTQPNADGIVRRGEGGSDSLVLERVPKKRFVGKGDTIVTAGSTSGGPLGSIYPRGILIGQVTSVGGVDTDLFRRIQVEPYVDFSSLQSVLVLVPKARR